MNTVLVRRAIIVLVVLALLVAAALFAARIPRTVSIFLIAAFIAFGAHPLVNRLETRMPRPVAIAVVYAGLLGALVVLALVIIPISVEQLTVLLSRAPAYAAASQDLVAQAGRTLRQLVGNRVPLPEPAQIQTEVGNRVSAFLGGVFSQLGPIVVGAVNALIVGTSALILSVFFLLQGREVRDGILRFVPPPRRPRLSALMHELSEVFGHFVAGQALLCAIVGAAVWLALAPSHFGFSLLVAVICGVGYAVPFVGMIAAQVIAALLAVPQGTGMVIWVTVAIFVIGRVADNVLVPKIMSESVGVSPITVMFAIFAGGELFGVPGLILGIPAAALLKVLFGYFVQPYVLRMQSQTEIHVDEPNVHVDVVVDQPEERAASDTVVVRVESINS
jgi:predicted PurR-regulated permease PerM